MEWKLIIHTPRPLGTQNKHSLGEKETEVCWGCKGDEKVLGSDLKPWGSPWLPGSIRHNQTMAGWKASQVSLSRPYRSKRFSGWQCLALSLFLPGCQPCTCSGDWANKDMKPLPDRLCWAQGPELPRQSVTAVRFFIRQRIYLASNGQHEKWGVQWRAGGQYSVM